MSATASRFSVLRIENDEDERRAQSLRDKQKAAAEKLSGKKGNGNKSQAASDKNAAHQQRPKMSQEKAELRSLAFGGSKPKKSSSSKKKNAAPAPAAGPEWSEWKSRDQNFVEDSYERQLEEALLASKLEYEEQKKAGTADQGKTLITTKEPQSATHKKKTGNNKKGTTTMSLDEFNQGPQVQEVKSKNAPVVNGQAVVEDESHFFEEMTEEAKKLASKEKNRMDAGKKKPSKPLQISDTPRWAQLEEELRQSQEEAAALRLENENLREELLNVKKRCKRLCGILAQGEMKEKAELVVEIEKRTKVEDELMAEVDNLSKQLEQERSKVTALTDAKKAVATKK